jgi:hypothetical protein
MDCLHRSWQRLSPFGVQLSWLAMKGLTKAIFESDCLSLVQQMNSQLMDWSSVGIIAAGIKHLVKDFSSVSFRHVKRVLNAAAHRLAKSFENVNSSVTFYSVPDFIRETLCNVVV